MRILVSNDDGINAPGIHSLARALKDIGDVTVVAPATQQTAKGHSLTIGHEIRVQKRFFEEGIPGYAVWGTPKDCIDLAVDALLDHRPDLIVTGINEGPNICNDCVSSGTLGGAIAGFINGIPSIATSLDVGKEYDYDKCSKIIREIALWFLQLPYNTEFALNVFRLFLLQKALEAAASIHSMLIMKLSEKMKTLSITSFREALLF